MADTTPEGGISRSPRVDEGLLSLVLELIPYAVYWKDLNFRYLGCNAEFARLAGRGSASDIVGLSDAELWPEEEATRVRAADQRVIESGEARTHVLETRLLEDGTTVWIDSSKLPLVESSGTVVGILGVFADVTEQRESELELERVRQHFSTAIETIQAGIVLYDKDERLVFCNEHYRRLYPIPGGPPSPGITYRALLERYARGAGLVTPEEIEDFVASRLSQHRKCEGEWIQELGEKTIRVSDRRTKDGGIVSLRTDITALKQIERELQFARDEAEAASVAKTSFLANMSHEIRTPMTAILGFTEVLLDRATHPEDVSALETVKKNGDSLLDLINDILDLSKIEAGKLGVLSQSFELHQLFDDVVELMRIRAKAKGLSLEIRYDSPIPRWVSSDAPRIRQVVVNLVSNAIKFTEVGGVTIVPRWVAGESWSGVEVEVLDTGIGMSSEQLARVFGAFEQADPSTTREHGGTGLGLTICRRLADLLGGTVEASSSVGEGSSFRFRFEDDSKGVGEFWHPPLLRKSPSAALRAPSEGGVSEVRRSAERAMLTDRKILLVEDGLDNQALISHLLRSEGATVQVADHGAMAIELIERGSEDSSGLEFDLILMDMQMPVLDGYGASRKLRESGWATPIVALTAHAMSGDRERCLESGCSDYLTKPVSREKLIDCCRKWLVSSPQA